MMILLGRITMRCRTIVGTKMLIGMSRICIGLNMEEINLAVTLFFAPLLAVG